MMPKVVLNRITSYQCSQVELYLIAMMCILLHDYHTSSLFDDPKFYSNSTTFMFMTLGISSMALNPRLLNAGVRVIYVRYWT